MVLTDEGRGNTEILKSDSVSIILVDFWDTLAHRDCSTEQIKREVCQEILVRFPLKMTIGQMFRLRKSLEDKLQRKYEEYKLVDLCKKMYTSINTDGRYGLIAANMDSFCHEFINRELECEKRHIYADEEMKEYLQSHEGNKFVVVSDFYMGGQELRILGEHVGLGKYIDLFYSSSDFGVRKSMGNLYKKIKEIHQFEYNDAMMIGDNRESDYKIPKMLGMKTYHRANRTKTIQTVAKPGKELIKMCSFAIKRDVPLLSYAYPLYYFIERLYKSLKAAGAKKVLFLSREGELLKRLFDMYLASHSLPDEQPQLETIYFFASRASTFLPACKNIMEEDFQIVFGQFGTITQLQFFTMLGLQEEMNKEGMNEYLSEKPIYSPNEFVQCLRSDISFGQLYERMRTEKKELFLLYMQQAGINIYEDEIILVDVGWRGTIQDNISNILDAKQKIRGYYLGIDGVGEYSNDSTKYGMVFTWNPIRSKDYEIWSENIITYERVLMGSHGGVITYRKEGDIVRPVLDDCEAEQEVFQEFVPYREELVREFAKINNFLCEVAYDIQDFYPAIVRCRWLGLYYQGKRCICFERYMENKWHENLGGKLLHYENKSYFGYLKKIAKQVKYKRRTLLQGVFLDFLAYFFKVKRMYGICSFFRKCYGHFAWHRFDRSCRRIDDFNVMY